MFSNVPGFLKPVYLGGKPATRFFSLVTGPGNMGVGINIVSMPELAQFCITADKYQIEDIDQFIGFFNGCIEEMEIKNDE